MKKNLLAALFTVMAGLAYAQCPTGETEVTMTIVTDRYGDETEWVVTGTGGSPTYASGGPYTTQNSAGEYPQTPVTFCVPDGTVLTITVTDTYGDGMCCSYGDGSWELSVGGTTIASGGSFESSESASVVIGGTDIGIETIGVPAVSTPGNVTISGTVRNFGTESVSSFTLDYTVDNGTPVQQVFATNVAVGGTAPFSFTTPWNAMPGTHDLDLDLSGVSNDAIASNNTASQEVAVATQIGTRLPLLEQFTSSTCGPCASLNDAAGFTDLLETLNPNSQTNAELAVVKYQYDFPGQGDHAYNAEVGSRVFGWYFTTSIGIPEVFINADYITNNGTLLNPNNILAYQDDPAVIDISATHTVVDGNEITVDVTVNPYIDLNAKLYIYLLEKHYEATNHSSFSNGETDFYHIFRKMLPNQNGTTLNLTAGTPFTTQRSYTATINPNLPTQGSYDFHAGTELEVIAFVQKPSDKTIYNAAISTGNTTLGLKNYDANTAIGVYPNPVSTDQLTVVMETETTEEAMLTITDIKGAVVLTEAFGRFGAGVSRRNVDVSNLSNGIYNVNVLANGHMHSKRVIVQK